MLLRQERLTKKYNTAKTVNYSGAAFNSGSIFVMLYGVNDLLANPSTLESFEMINTFFKLDINFAGIFATIEEFKAQLIGLCLSIQTFFVYYQDICSKLKNADREDMWTFINEELGKVVP